jgi:hypothetical protein
MTPYRYTREDALAIAHRLIEVCHQWDPRLLQYQRGYFAGLVQAWSMAGLISDEEAIRLHEALAEALEKAHRSRRPPPWWDIASRLGI